MNVRSYGRLFCKLTILYSVLYEHSAAGDIDGGWPLKLYLKDGPLNELHRSDALQSV